MANLPVTGSLGDQYRAFLQDQRYGVNLLNQQQATFGQLNPAARREMLSRFTPRATEFGLFGSGEAPSTFADYLQAGTPRTTADINTQVQNLRQLLAQTGGGLGGGFGAKQAATLRGLYADDPEAQMNVGLLGAERGLNPYFRTALRRGAEQGFDAYRSANPGTSFLDYANQIGLLGSQTPTPIFGDFAGQEVVV
jgi:hypothetical protein